MSTRLPTVFLSSTFYDLRQVRADIVDFIEGALGYRAVASEFPSFPVDPDLDAIENCRRVVAADADVLVLVIGGRYGYEAIPGQSVTNMEYKVARAKGIPIYSFVQRDVLAVLPTWKANPGGDFSNTVDSTGVFEFIEEIRERERGWVFPFDSAKQITEHLRTQLAYAFYRGIDLQSRMRGSDDSLATLRGESLRLALERPPGWQGKLFAQILVDEVTRRRDMRRAYDTELAFGQGDVISDSDIPTWVNAKTTEAIRLTSGTTRLINETLSKAFATADVADILFAGRQTGRAYEEAMQWAGRIRLTHLGERWVDVAREMSLITSDVVTKLESLGPNLAREIESALSKDEEHVVIRMTVVLDAANIENCHAALRRAME